MAKFDRLEASLTEDGRYRLLVEAVTDYAIYVLDADGIVTGWNPGAQRFKGYLPEEIIGTHFSAFYSAEDQKAGVPERALRQAALEGRFENEGWRVRKDGTQFWAHVVIDPIRTPAGAILGFAKITRNLTERRMELDRYLSAAQRAAKRAATLTHRLLAFSRRQRLDPKSTDVNRLVQEMDELMRRAMGPAIAVEVAAQAGLWATLIDPNPPRHHGQAEDALPKTQSPDLQHSEVGETILVIDDDPTIRTPITEVLEELGYQTIEAEDGPGGLKILETTRRIDLLITDVDLPGGLNGRQIADAALVFRPQLKVLFITGYAENAVVGNDQLTKGMQILSKPFTINQLRSQVRNMLPEK